jgi:hypothetical protein
LVQGSMAHHRKTHLLRTPSPRAPFIQLAVREPELVEAVLVQGLCMLPCTSQKGS